MHAFRLQPFRAPAGAVRLVEPLRDDAFEVVLASDAEEIGAGAPVILDVADALRLTAARVRDGKVD